MSIGRLLVPVAVALVFALSRRYLPVSSNLSFTERDAKEFSRLQWLVGAAMLTVGCVFGLLSYKALLWANAAMAGRDPSRHFLILPGHWIWFFLPFFGAICLAWEITLRLWRLLGDPVQARKYESWSNFKAGFNATRVLQIMIVTMEVPIANRNRHPPRAARPGADCAHGLHLRAGRCGGRNEDQGLLGAEAPRLGAAP